MELATLGIEVDSATTAGRVQLHRVGDDDVDAPTRIGLAECWAATANAGGAVGFPWPPVRQDEAETAVDGLVENVSGARTHLIVARDPVGVTGWVSLDRNEGDLVAHWATVRRLQTDPRARGRGVGTRLMTEVARLARDELELQQLHLAIRGGMGLETFYERLRWTVVGTWPRATAVQRR